jgi:hypothetical protein
MGQETYHGVKKQDDTVLIPLKHVTLLLCISLINHVRPDCQNRTMTIVYFS